MMDGQTYTRLNEVSTKPPATVAWWDAIGKCWTVGVGCTGSDITHGTEWSPAKIESEYEKRYASAVAGAARVATAPVWSGLSEVRKAVLADMCYNMGVAGLSGFVNMLAAVRAGDWKTAYAELLASRAAKQTPARILRNARMLKDNAWQPGYGA